jgi:hypothetical protein
MPFGFVFSDGTTPILMPMMNLPLFTWVFTAKQPAGVCLEFKYHSR